MKTSERLQKAAEELERITKEVNECLALLEEATGRTFLDEDTTLNVSALNIENTIAFLLGESILLKK